VALPKLVCERIARSFASRTGADIYALRIGVVIEPADYGRFPAALADPLSRKRDAWSYIDVRDLARILDLCLEKDGLGFQVFNATNDEIIANEPTTSSLTKHAPRTPMPANSRGSRLRCPIETRGSFWASASCTTGEKCAPGRDRFVSRDSPTIAARQRVERSGRESTQPLAQAFTAPAVSPATI
jgi:hypothetical protein